MVGLLHTLSGRIYPASAEDQTGWADALIKGIMLVNFAIGAEFLNICDGNHTPAHGNSVRFQLLDGAGESLGLDIEAAGNQCFLVGEADFGRAVGHHRAEMQQEGAQTLRRCADGNLLQLLYQHAMA